MQILCLISLIHGVYASNDARDPEIFSLHGPLTRYKNSGTSSILRCVSRPCNSVWMLGLCVTRLDCI